MITVFTATYNRALTLKRAFQSLDNQTCRRFEWVVIDDGSTDETEQIIANFKTINFEIRYFKQENKGKHAAINKGVELARGDFFFILDSDDFLPCNALAIVFSKFAEIKNINGLAGIAGRKSYFNGQLVGSTLFFKDVISNAIDIRFKHKVEGDLTEVFYTNILKEFPFPEFKNEKFCPESLIWNRIAKNYDLLYINQSLYNCEYLRDGLTSNIVKIRMNSPLASMLCYAELASYKIPLTQKIRATINFWRFAFCSKISFYHKLQKVSFIFSILALPLGFFMHLNDLKNSK